MFGRWRWRRRWHWRGHRRSAPRQNLIDEHRGCQGKIIAHQAAGVEIPLEPLDERQRELLVTVLRPDRRHDRELGASSIECLLDTLRALARDHGSSQELLRASDSVTARLEGMPDCIRHLFLALAAKRFAALNRAEQHGP